VVNFSHQTALPPEDNTGTHGKNSWVGSREAVVRNEYILKMRILEKMEHDGRGCLVLSCWIFNTTQIYWLT
jgi:hypothetical protein